ncbi:MAG: hypothetical protein V4679_19110 [Pseudomonadota bacterium]
MAQASIRIEETAQAVIPCPCGCAALHEQHDGVVHFAQGGGHFRALLMREPAGEPSIWLSITTRGPAHDPQDWLVTLHGDAEGARIEDPGASPIALPASYAGRQLQREELMAMAGVPGFYFACFDALLEQHSRMRDFLRE